LRTKFEKWLHVLKFGDLYRSVEDLPEDLKKEIGIIEVVNKMAVANTNEHLREIMISREMFLLDINTEKQAARKEGRKEGQIEGKAQLILQMLREGDISAEKAETKLTALQADYTDLSFWPEIFAELRKISPNRVKEEPARYKTRRKPTKPPV